ncbi:MAG TPA: coproporphyrinogen dehydrogenase HemZ [Candidatus Blautia intestinigallinarum]|nr:coproporphyrinogen dehydrogenase HemZ [Candidatus Blautia intestinigallinarum]
MKRGIIPLCSIGVRFNEKNFEYDVYSLVKAFYPGREVHICYEEEKKSFPEEFVVEYQKDRIHVAYRKEGQSQDQEEIALIHTWDRKMTKDRLKQGVYQLLRRLTGKELPWGTLTGIRPTKLVMGMIESGMTNPQIAQFMWEEYYVSPQKAALGITIANREREILKEIDYENGYSLYVGIPFCPSICLYCSFSSYPYRQWEKRVGEYVDALKHEICEVSKMMKGRTLDTVYLGGGTPTTLPPEYLDEVLTCIEEHFPCDGLHEYTVEAGRPDSFTREKLLAIRKHPVTRISVNPQTMNQKTLEIIGRRHTVEDTVNAFYLARECGFDNINMDLIVGLPGEGKDEVSHTLEEIRKLDPDSLTVHSLAIKRAARLNMFRDQYQEMTFENNQEIMDMTTWCAYDMGMGPYYLYRQKNMAGNFENVGYAKVDKAGIYNILIMEEKQPIIALGAGGSTKLVFDHGQRIERVENVKDVTNYISRIDEMIERKRIGITSYL